MSIQLEAKQVTNRGHKFGIVAGKSILAKFKTLNAAEEDLNKNRKFYEYWAGSISVGIENSEKKVIII